VLTGYYTDVDAKDADAFRAWLVTTKKKDSKAEVTAQELEGWHEAILGAVLGAGRPAVRNQLLFARLGWQRSSHLEGALATAKAKRFVD
jgi:hypothetical protein